MNKFVIIVAAAVLSLIGCAKDEPTPAPTTSMTTASPSTSAMTPTADPGITPAPTASNPAVEGMDWPTTDSSSDYAVEVPPMPTLQAVRSGTHAEYDRVAFEFTNLPSYTAGYVSGVRYDGSGELVELDGEAFLQLVFNPAQAHDDEGHPSLPSSLLNQVSTGYPAIEAYVMNGDYEGYVSIALGMSNQLGYNVEYFQQPSGSWVVYVDVAHP